MKDKKPKRRAKSKLQKPVTALNYFDNDGDLYDKKSSSSDATENNTNSALTSLSLLSSNNIQGFSIKLRLLSFILRFFILAIGIFDLGITIFMHEKCLNQCYKL